MTHTESNAGRRGLKETPHPQLLRHALDESGGTWRAFSSRQTQ
jgi:hypothetical protein